MENNELQNIWRTLDTGKNMKSKEELKLLLISKAKQVFKELLIVNVIAIPVCIGVIVWLIITTINRSYDVFYVTNNILLGLFVLTALLTGIWYWVKFQTNRMNKPVKGWLDETIDLLSKWLIGRFKRIEYFLLPVLFILTFLSIHVYYADLYFVEVFRSDKFLKEDMWGMIFSTPLVLAGMFYVLIKIRKYHIKKLQFLKDLRNRLSNDC